MEINDSFYNDSKQYWTQIPATINGMLGGFGFVSHKDIEGSRIFLQQVFQLKNAPEKKYALDCGAGIGRITKYLLMEIFERIDLVEQNPAFLEKAKKFVGAHKLGELYPVGLQDFCPDDDKYDVIWCQWVTGYLKDQHLIEFLQRCKKSLKRNGLMIVKDNVTSSGEVEMDTCDSSLTRPLKSLWPLFQKAGFKCVKETKQTNFPKGLYAVHMMAFSPEYTENYTDCIQPDQDT